MNVKEEIKRWSDGIIKGLEDNYNKLGLKGTGNWPKDLSYEIIQRGNNFRVPFYGSKYTKFLVSGRSPNKNQSPEALHAWVGWAGSTFLAEWVKNKGIDASPFAVGYKIARVGITVPNAYNPGTLVSDVLSDESVSDLLDSLMNLTTIKLRADIRIFFSN